MIGKQGTGLRWLFSTLWVQGFSKDGFNWNKVLSKKNRKLLLINPRNQSYGNMDISVQKQNFYLNIDSVLRKNYMKTIMVVKPQRLMIWSRISEFPTEKKTCFSGILRKKQAHKWIAWTSAPLTQVYLLKTQTDATKMRPPNSKKSWGKKATNVK